MTQPLFQLLTIDGYDDTLKHMSGSMRYQGSNQQMLRNRENLVRRSAPTRPSVLENAIMRHDMSRVVWPFCVGQKSCLLKERG